MVAATEVCSNVWRERRFPCQYSCRGSYLREQIHADGVRCGGNNQDLSQSDCMCACLLVLSLCSVLIAATQRETRKGVSGWKPAVLDGGVLLHMTRSTSTTIESVTRALHYRRPDNVLVRNTSMEELIGAACAAAIYTSPQVNLRRLISPFIERRPDGAWPPPHSAVRALCRPLRAALIVLLGHRPRLWPHSSVAYQGRLAVRPSDSAGPTVRARKCCAHFTASPFAVNIYCMCWNNLGATHGAAQMGSPPAQPPPQHSRPLPVVPVLEQLALPQPLVL